MPHCDCVIDAKKFTTKLVALNTVELEIQNVLPNVQIRAGSDNSYSSTLMKA